MILDPPGPILDPVLEGENFEIVLTGDYLTINIEHDFPSTVTVEDNKISGLFNLVFELPNNGLKYRLGLDYGIASSFNELPNEADIYSYSPPVARIRDYNFKVDITYIDIASGGSEQYATFYYTLPVEINYDLYSKALRDFIWRQ